MKRIIQNNAVYEKRSAHRRCCWYVHSQVLARLGQEALPVPCQWTYLTSGAREEVREEPLVAGAGAATGSQGNSPGTPQPSTTTTSTSSTTTPSGSNKRKSTGSMSITKFMKKCTDRGRVGGKKRSTSSTQNPYRHHLRELENPEHHHPEFRNPTTTSESLKTPPRRV